LEERRGEMEAEDRRGDGEVVERRGEVFLGIGEGARRSRDFCPASIDWGMTMI